MRIKYKVSVDMMGRGAAAVFNLVDDDEKEYSYRFLVNKNLVLVLKDQVEIIGSNDVLNPLKPDENEASVINMANDLDGFDTKLYHIACGLAVLHNNDASDDYAVKWMTSLINEILANEH